MGLYSMATVYKRNGVGNYLIGWFDHTGKRCTKSSGTTCKATATRIANKLEADVSLRRENVIDVRLEDIAKEGAKPLTEALDAYQASLSASGKSQDYIDRTRNKFDAIALHAGWSKLADVSADGLNLYSASLRKSDKSPRTIASYIQAAKGFTRWALTNGKLVSDPLVTIKKPNAESDRRLVRRYLTHEEWTWLDSTTRQSQERFGMTGQERVVLYSLAIQTGLRSSELRSLTRGSLFLKGPKPYITVKAADTKNSKQAKQYIQIELATELLGLASKKLAGAKVFNLPHESTIVDMIREDIDRARGKWLETIKEPQQRLEAEQGGFLSTLNGEGQSLDFHALRHTCGTWLAQAGVDIKTVQTIMRHSTIVLTLDRYGHLYEGAESDAIAKVRSSFIVPSSMTGTNAIQGVQQKRQQLGCGSIRIGADSCGEPNHHNQPSGHEKTLVSQRLTEKNQGLGAMRALGLEPRTQGLKVHGASMESQGETNHYSEYDSNQDDSALVGITELLQNLGSCKRAIELLADQSQGEHEQSILAKVLSDVRSALRGLERLQ
jgi:integrase